MLGFVTAVLIGLFVVFSLNYAEHNDSGKALSVFGLFDLGSKEVATAMVHTGYWPLIAVCLMLIVNFGMSTFSDGNALMPAIFIPSVFTLAAGGYFMHYMFNDTVESSAKQLRIYTGVIMACVGIFIGPWTIKFFKLTVKTITGLTTPLGMSME